MARKELTVEPRSLTGNKVATLRRAGVLPANVCGKGLQSQAVQIDLDGGQTEIKNTEVDFEIASSADGPPLVHAAATMATIRSGSVLAQGVSDMRVLPPGNYIARAKVKSGEAVVGEVRRSFTLT